MITIKPYGGLGNRMRAIDSVIAIAKKNHLPVQLIWEKTHTLNCDFSKLFIVPDSIELINKGSFYPKLTQKISYILKKLLKRIGIILPLGYEKYIFEEELAALRKDKYDFNNLKNYSSVFIYTQHRFFSDSNPFISFKPVQDIQNRVDEITKSFNNYTIGIHIRRTDNILSILASPLDAFIDLMKNEIKTNNNANFFVATDSPEEEQTLKSIFPGKIITYDNKYLDRNSPKAIQDALIDMLCLSKTRKIIGSYWSSFSETAAAIGKLELELINVNNPN